MILSQEQVEKRLNSEANIANTVDSHKIEVVIKDGKNHEGRPGATNLTENEKVAIGVLAGTVGNELAAELMGVSEHTARHLRTGQMTVSDGRGTQRYGENTNLRNAIEERINNTKLTVQERAAEKLLKTMGLIDDDKLANASAKELAQISSQMSQVVRNMNNNVSRDSGGKGGVKIVLHQPKVTREEDFEVLEIQAG